MILPELGGVARSADYKIEFKGINHNLFVGEDNFWDTYNLCSTDYPVMTPRAARATVATLTNPQGIYARGKLMWAADNKLYYDGTQVAGVTLTNGQKQFVGMGAYIIVFPDGIRYNTSTGAVDSLEASYTGTGFRMDISRIDGETYSPITASATEPASPSAGDAWLDTSVQPNSLKVYTSAGTWSPVLAYYTKISKADSDIGTNFKEGDAVKFTFNGTVSSQYNGVHRIVAVDDDWIVAEFSLQGAIAGTGISLSLARTVPSMDFVCELNNRLWGCSSSKHEIYACKLGDPTNWNTLGTGAGDAWAATVGSDGDFTGCCAFAGCVLFWKEDMLHKVMGTKPGNFQIIDTPMRGVQKGSEKSICHVNEVLIYKSRDGVMIYDGSGPTNVGAALGTERLFDASAGAEGDRYYVSMKTEGGQWGLWVFNEAKGLWHREDEIHATAFAALDGQLYFLTSAGKLMAVRGREEAAKLNSTATVEDPFDWWAETGDMMIERPTNRAYERQFQADMKYLNRLQVRASVAEESMLRIEIMYDSDGQWKTLFRREKSRKASFTVPLVPGRCDHFRLRISGHGRSAVYAISKEYSAGSEI